VPFPPDWFLHAALAEVRRLEEDDPEDCCPLDIEDAMAWLASRPPHPDENQRRAGWDWIGAQAWKHRLAKYGDDCAEGRIAVFSIREASSSQLKRIAERVAAKIGQPGPITEPEAAFSGCGSEVPTARRERGAPDPMDHIR
jgi:hypothetical protein